MKHREAWKWTYQRDGVMPNYVPEGHIPSTIDNVWGARTREDRFKNRERAEQWREKARAIGKS